MKASWDLAVGIWPVDCSLQTRGLEGKQTRRQGWSHVQCVVGELREEEQGTSRGGYQDISPLPGGLRQHGFGARGQVHKTRWPMGLT